MYKLFVKDKVFSAEQSRKIIDIFESKSDPYFYNIITRTGNRVMQEQVDLERDDYPDIYKVVESSIVKCNAVANWNFELTDFQQRIRIAKYTRGYRHDWHVDYLDSDTSKIAFSCLLNNDFDGGSLELLEHFQPIKIRVGEAVLFPAYHGHRVTPVKRGTRYVLLAWYTGPRFK